MLDLVGSEPLRSILAVIWSLLFLTLAFAVIIGVPVAIGVSEQRRRRPYDTMPPDLRTVVSRAVRKVLGRLTDS
jgi:hypothetical protein